MIGRRSFAHTAGELTSGESEVTVELTRGIVWTREGGYTMIQENYIKIRINHNIILLTIICHTITQSATV